jgi:hypothetical protein
MGMMGVDFERMQIQKVFGFWFVYQESKFGQPEIHVLESYDE